METHFAVGSMEKYCPYCIHFDDKLGVCSKIHENVRSYPKKFLEKCYGKYFEKDQERVIEITEEVGEKIADMTMDQKITYIIERLDAIENRLPDSDIIHQRFWKRAWTVFGYNMATTFIIYCIIFILAIFLSIFFE